MTNEQINVKITFVWLMIKLEPFILAEASMRMGAETGVEDFKLITSIEGFDPGSERTLAAWLRHASRTRTR